MVTKKIIFIAVLLSVSTTNAQFFKKLIKRAQKSAEKSIEKKVEQKTQKETDKFFDKTVDRKKEQGKRSSLTKTYDFSHKYLVEIENHRGKKNQLIYYLANNKPYICTVVPKQKQFKTVVDFDDEKIYTFIDDKKGKTLITMRLPIDDFSKVAEGVSVTTTGKTKTINGFLCKEYTIKSTEIEGTAWVTDVAGVTINKSFYKTKSTKKMKKQNFMSKVNGLLIESTITDLTSRKRKTTKTRCVGLEKKQLILKASNYKQL